MTAPAGPLHALARAYHMTARLPSEYPDVLEALASAAPSEAVEVEVRESALRVEGGELPDPDGTLRELARDLRALGVERFRLPDGERPDALLTFLRWVRRGHTRSVDDARTELARPGGVEVELGGIPARARGLARSIAALFDAPGPAGPPTPEEGAGTPRAEGAAPPAEPPQPTAPGDASSTPADPSVPAAPGGVPPTPAGTPEPAASDESPPARRWAALVGHIEPLSRSGEAAFRPAARDGSLAGAVEAFQKAHGRERGMLARGILRAGDALLGQGLTGAVADAVEALLVPSDAGAVDGESADLAVELARSEVCGELVERLGSARSAERRAELELVAGLLGSRMTAALGEALTRADDRSSRRIYLDALAAQGDGARPVALEMLRDPRWYAVRNGLRLLAEIGGAPDWEALEPALVHEEPRVRREAVRTAARLGAGLALPRILPRLEDDDPGVREAAAVALGTVGGGAAVRPLAQALRGERRRDVQVSLIRALGTLGDPAALPALEKKARRGLLRRSPREVRIAAYRALAAVGTPRAHRALARGLKDGDPEVRATVASHLDASD